MDVVAAGGYKNLDKSTSRNLLGISANCRFRAAYTTQINCQYVCSELGHEASVLLLSCSMILSRTSRFQIIPSTVMESRRNAIVIPEVIFAILAGSIVSWRVINNVVLKRLFRLADLLIFLALVMLMYRT